MGLLCVSCGRNTRKTFGWIKANDTFQCSCGAVTDLKTADFREAIAKMERFLRSVPSSKQAGH